MNKRLGLSILAAALCAAAGFFLPGLLVKAPLAYIKAILVGGFQEVMMFGLPAVLLLRGMGITAANARSQFRLPTSMDAGLSLLGAVAYTLTGTLLSVLTYLLLQSIGLHITLPDIPAPGTPVELMAALLFIALLTALCEELLFRWALVELLKKRVSWKTAAFISAILFTALHFSLIATPALFLFALLQHRLASRKESLLLPILFHAMYNGSILVMTYANAEPGLGTMLLSAVIFIVSMRMLFKDDADEIHRSGL